MAFDTNVEVVKADDITSFSTLPLYSPGARTSQSGNDYLYVFAAGGAIGTGKYCVLDQNNGTSLTSGYSCMQTNASLNGWMVGVAQNTIAASTYGWVMVNGVSLISTDSGEVSANAGVDLSLGTNGGFIAAGVTFSTSPRFATTLNSFITGATSKGRIFNSIIGG